MKSSNNSISFGNNTPYIESFFTIMTRAEVKAIKERLKKIDTLMKNRSHILGFIFSLGIYYVFRVIQRMCIKHCLKMKQRELNLSKVPIDVLETRENKATSIEKPPSPSMHTDSPVSLVTESLPPSPQTVEDIQPSPTSVKPADNPVSLDNQNPAPSPPETVEDIQPSPTSVKPADSPVSLENQNPAPSPPGTVEDIVLSPASHKPAEISPPQQTSPTNSPRSSTENIQNQLAEYLSKVDKSSIITLPKIKEALATKGKELFSKMDFFIYMHEIVNNPISKKAFQGISNQAIKANPMFIQLQKKIQREVGTYPKEFDKSLIKSTQDLQNNLKEYAASRGLDSKKLETLFYEVANANKKTRVTKTKELTAYMLSK
jgi:hypothetical protein